MRVLRGSQKFRHLVLSSLAHKPSLLDNAAMQMQCRRQPAKQRRNMLLPLAGVSACFSGLSAEIDGQLADLQALGSGPFIRRQSQAPQH